MSAEVLHGLFSTPDASFDDSLSDVCLACCTASVLAFGISPCATLVRTWHSHIASSACPLSPRMAGKRKGAATKAAPSTQAPEPSAPSTATGFSQFKGEGPLFYIRQFGGFVIAIIGVLILASGYTEDYALPIGTTGSCYLSLAFIVAGLVVHECRPWKVRNDSSPSRDVSCCPLA